MPSARAAAGRALATFRKPLALRVVLTLGLAAATRLAGAADLEPASAALCLPAQRVMFHCSLGAKAVSLCADMDGERVRTLGYRYGTPGHIELDRAVSVGAGANRGTRFSATVAPVAPRANVRQLWFMRGGFTYLLSQCVGGACPRAAGLAVLRGAKVLSNQACVRSADDRARFAPELAHFGSDASNSRSLTELLTIDGDADHGIERLYRVN